MTTLERLFIKTQVQENGHQDPEDSRISIHWDVCGLFSPQISYGLV